MVHESRIRCINRKENKVRMLSPYIANNPITMRRIGFEIDDPKLSEKQPAVTIVKAPVAEAQPEGKGEMEQRFDNAHPIKSDFSGSPIDTILDEFGISEKALAQKQGDNSQPEIPPAKPTFSDDGEAPATGTVEDEFKAGKSATKKRGRPKKK